MAKTIMAVKRNYSLDYIKGIACICVVFMHSEFPGWLGIMIQCISRFCVPFFFMISGYFCYRGSATTDYRKKIKHLGTIILGAAVFYLIITPLYKSGFSITVLGLIKWIFFNVPPYIAPQLWFIFALLYDYLLFAFVERFKCRKLAYIAIPVGIGVYIIMAQGAHLLGFSIPNLLYRNFLIEGFPLFSLGYWIHEHQNDIKISNKILILIVIVATLLCPVERLLMGRDFGVNIVSFPQVLALFLLGVRNPNFGSNKMLSKFGSKYSMYVYVIHPAVLHLMEMMYNKMHINSNMLLLHIQPIVCVILTVLLSIVFLRFNNAIQAKVSLRS